MRISDWSSDVCSSDLNRKRSVFNGPYPVPEVGSVPAFYLRAPSPRHSVPVKSGRRPPRKAAMPSLPSNPPEAVAMLFASHRSEEHTSELQSLMRTQYAVLCLQKKNKIITNTEL